MLLGDGTRWSARACWVYDMAARGPPQGGCLYVLTMVGPKSQWRSKEGLGEADTVRADVFWENVWA